MARSTIYKMLTRNGWRRVAGSSRVGWSPRERGLRAGAQKMKPVPTSKAGRGALTVRAAASVALTWAGLPRCSFIRRSETRSLTDISPHPCSTVPNLVVPSNCR